MLRDHFHHMATSQDEKPWGFMESLIFWRYDRICRIKKKKKTFLQIQVCKCVMGFVQIQCALNLFTLVQYIQNFTSSKYEWPLFDSIRVWRVRQPSKNITKVIVNVLLIACRFFFLVMFSLVKIIFFSRSLLLLSNKPTSHRLHSCLHWVNKYVCESKHSYRAQSQLMHICQYLLWRRCWNIKDTPTVAA